MIATTPPSPIINLTLEEAQRRKTRALHVRVTGVKEIGNVEEDVKGLLKRMTIPEPTHTRVWRVGKKETEGTSKPNERALILLFPTEEARKEFLKKLPMLKENDLTVAQVAHMKEKMSKILAAREKKLLFTEVEKW